MGSFGDRLKREREKKQITLDEVAVTTKIGTRLLQALEDEKFDLLPGGVFNKGFVKAYAEYLGMDPDEAVADYLTAAGDKPVVQPEDQELRAIAEKREKEKQHPRVSTAQRAGATPWGLVAAFLLVTAVSLAGWGFYSRDRNGHENVQAAETTPPPANPTPTTAGTLPATANPASTENTPLTTASSDQMSPIPASQVTSSEPVPEPVESPVPPASTSSRRSARSSPAAIPAAQRDHDKDQQSNDDYYAGAGTSAFALQITAREDSWLTLTVDSRIVFQGLLSSASAKTVLANKQVILKTGNIGALDIAFNGSKIAAQGAEDEVKILTFDANGLEP